MYKTPLWLAIRSRQLRENPLCETCLSEGRIVSANVAHHLIPHRGDRDLFYKGKLKSLCDKCHNSIEQSYEKSGYHKQIGRDGWPIDSTHPAYKPVVSSKNKKNF